MHSISEAEWTNLATAYWKACGFGSYTSPPMQDEQASMNNALPGTNQLMRHQASYCHGVWPAASSLYALSGQPEQR